MTWERITSAANQRVKRLQALQKKAKLRKQEQAFIVEGERLFHDTPAQYVREIYVTEKFLAEHGETFIEEKAACGPAGRVSCTVLTQEIFAKISDTQTPQGVLCVAQMPSYTESDLLHGAGSEQADGAGTAAPFLVLLENLQDPGNVGTIFRTAEAAGVTGIVMSSDTADLFNPKTVRATMSAVFRMPFLYTDDLTGVIGRLKAGGIEVYAAHLDAQNAYDEYTYLEGCAFLIGNEGNGLTEAAAAAASKKLLIPMHGGIESLNASVAAGILMYEASRQRRMNSI